MKTFYSPAHLGHAPKQEFDQGRLSPAVEIPARAEAVKAEIERRKLGPVLAPDGFANDAILRVHNGHFVAFLERAYADWRTEYWRDPDSDAYPSVWPPGGAMRRQAGDIEARLGSYCFDTATPICKGTFAAARAAVDTVLSAARAVKDGARGAFALARPPGHHASAETFGGFCYFNNAAIAAQFLADAGLRPAIVDVDYHHGNGTQAIFYARGDVLFCSIHADPGFAYPYFLGYADETGQGAGAGFNLNLPLPKKTDWPRYAGALDAALARVRDFGADVLLISLGLDTFEDDPICRFRLKTEDYLRMGAKIASLRLPTLFVFEGGYNIERLGANTANVLEGFEGG